MEKEFLSLFIEPLWRNIIIVIELNSKHVVKALSRIKNIEHAVVQWGHLIYIKPEIEQIKYWW